MTLALARIAHVSRWRRFRSWLRAKLHRCRTCVTISTPEGIGGQCVDCGRIHGWVTSGELRSAWTNVEIVGIWENGRTQPPRPYVRPVATSLPGPPERVWR